MLAKAITLLCEPRVKVSLPVAGSKTAQTAINPHKIGIQGPHAFAIVVLSLLVSFACRTQTGTEQDPVRAATTGKVLVRHGLQQGQGLSDEYLYGESMRALTKDSGTQL
jgi:hypothetical protein